MKKSKLNQALLSLIMDSAPEAIYYPPLNWPVHLPRCLCHRCPPLAIKSVKSLISKNKLTNVETILSGCKTGLPDESIDVVLLYDTFHMLSDPDGVLDELHRVLKPEGTLSFSDHHMREKEILVRGDTVRTVSAAAERKKDIHLCEGIELQQ